MQMIWKIDKKFETRQRKNKQTNKKQQQKRQEKKIHHRIHKDKGNTMIYKTEKKWGGRTKPLGHLQES